MAASDEPQTAVNVTLRHSLSESLQVTWDILLIGRKFYVKMTSDICPDDHDGVTEFLFEVFKYAEELKCSHVIFCFNLNNPRPDKVQGRCWAVWGHSVLEPGNTRLERHLSIS